MARPEITGRKTRSEDIALAAPPPIRGPPPIARACFSILEFCEAHRISESMYFKLKKQGRGPREMRVGDRVLISVESAADWRAAREAETAAAPSSTTNNDIESAITT
jgi:hypothetical protein